MFIRLTLSAYRERLSICVFTSFDFEGGLLDLIALVPGHCFSFYVSQTYLFQYLDCFIL